MTKKTGLCHQFVWIVSVFASSVLILNNWQKIRHLFVMFYVCMYVCIHDTGIRRVTHSCLYVHVNACSAINLSKLIQLRIIWVFHQLWRIVSTLTLTMVTICFADSSEMCNTWRKARRRNGNNRHWWWHFTVSHGHHVTVFSTCVRTHRRYLGVKSPPLVVRRGEIELILKNF